MLDGSGARPGSSSTLVGGFLVNVKTRRVAVHFGLLGSALLLGLATGSTALGGSSHPAPSPTPSLPPQDPIETVFSTNASGDRLLRLDFRTGTADFVNTDADARVAKRLEGIAVRDDVPGVSVIAADSVGQGLRFYPEAEGPDLVDGQVIASIPWPDGVSLDAKGNLFLVSSPYGPKVWTLPVGGSRPGGYGDPVLVDPAVPATALEDTKSVGFTAGTLQAGDLLVLSRVPATVFRYRKGSGGWERQVFVPGTQFPGGASPTGMSFSPRQDLLVSTLSGTILRFDTSGLRVLPDFAGGCGSGRLKIAVGIQEGKSRAFVANRSNGGKVLRFLIQPDGTGTPDGDVNERVSQPNGVGLASSSAVATPTGTSVTVKPAPEVEIGFDVVSAAGLTGTRVVEFVDNRSCPYHACDQSLKAFLPDDPKLQALLPDVTVPAFAQALRKLLPGDLPGHPSGPPTFMLALIKTTAGFQRTAASHFEEEERGILGQCAGLGPQSAQEGEPRTFYAPETGSPKLEPGLVEGETFIDISDGCGSNKGTGWNFSLYLTGRDPSTPVQIMDRKIPGLRLAFNALSGHIASPVSSELDGELADAEAAFALFRASQHQADKDATLSALQAFRSTIDANPGAFDNAGAGRNVSGELVARASSALFILPKAPPVVVSPVPVPFQIVIGDNDGYGNAFGLLSCPVADNQSFPSKLLGYYGEYTARDGRSPAEKAATNGAQQTDFYSALTPASPGNPIGLPASFDLVFPVSGTLTSAKLEIDMGSFEATVCRQISVSINGVPQPGFLAFSDGPLATRVRKIPFTTAQLAAANLARPLRVTLSRGTSTDKVAFDYFKLSGEVIP
jgi:hypothetical protein